MLEAILTAMGFALILYVIHTYRKNKANSWRMSNNNRRDYSTRPDKYKK